MVGGKHGRICHVVGRSKILVPLVSGTQTAVRILIFGSCEFRHLHESYEKKANTSGIPKKKGLKTKKVKKRKKKGYEQAFMLL